MFHDRIPPRPARPRDDLRRAQRQPIRQGKRIGRGIGDRTQARGAGHRRRHRAAGTESPRDQIGSRWEAHRHRPAPRAHQGGQRKERLCQRALPSGFGGGSRIPAGRERGRGLPQFGVPLGTGQEEGPSTKSTASSNRKARSALPQGRRNWPKPRPYAKSSSASSRRPSTTAWWIRTLPCPPGRGPRRPSSSSC
jgi:hypothetical protein